MRLSSNSTETEKRRLLSCGGISFSPVFGAAALHNNRIQRETAKKVNRNRQFQ